MDTNLIRRTLPSVSFGFDSLLDEIDRVMGHPHPAKFPPYNVIKVDDQNYRIDVAVAGYKDTDLEVTHDKEKHRLSISGSIQEKTEDDVNYIHRGLSNRNFELKFFIGDHYEVNDVFLDNGQLTLNLSKVIPEELLPKSIPIRMPLEKKKKLKAA